MEKEKSFIIDAKRANSLYKKWQLQVKDFAEQKAQDSLPIIYQNIEEAALNGKCVLLWTFDIPEATAEYNHIRKTLITKDLRKNGYVVSEFYPSKNITISWGKLKNNEK